MSYHVNDVVKGAFYHLRNIAKIRKYINNHITEVLIHYFVSSKLDFCNSLFYGLLKYEIIKLQNVPNAAARVITCLVACVNTIILLQLSGCFTGCQYSKESFKRSI
jgi:heme/copper-type cytochrome/quinol oxidase subunit 3